MGAQTQLEDALALARACGDTDVEAQTLTHLAVAAYRLNRDPVLNVQRYRRALDLWRAHGPRARVASRSIWSRCPAWPQPAMPWPRAGST